MYWSPPSDHHSLLRILTLAAYLFTPTYTKTRSAWTPTDGGNKTATTYSLNGCTIQNLFADEIVPGMHLACVRRRYDIMMMMRYVSLSTAWLQNHHRFAVACVSAPHRGSRLKASVFHDGQNSTTTNFSCAADYDAFRETIEEMLGLSLEARKLRETVTPNSRQPWKTYTPQGFPIESLEDLKDGANDVIIYEGGESLVRVRWERGREMPGLLLYDEWIHRHCL